MGKRTNTSAFKAYCQKIVTQFSSGEAREHAYRPALQEYIESFGDGLRVTNEPGKRGKGRKGDTINKPDFIVARGQAPVGFVEAKDIGVNLNDVGESEQIARYCDAYPNLILTDYIEFRRYVKGEQRGKSVRIGKANDLKKTITFSDTAEEQLTQFFDEFLIEDVESVSSPQELASRLAHLTRQVKNLVRQELEVEEESVRLHKLMLAFKKVLLTDLNVEKFSDMFAQTLAYGFFAARVHHEGDGEFSRRTASSILPRTNPFLRRVFAEFANESLPDTLVGAVDEIVDLLRRTDIKSVLAHFGEQGREDPVVHFYESFLRAYDPKLKKAMGVFYTPDPVVSYMVRSLDQILIKKFGRKKGLADDKTLILDPALGTGSYLHKVVEHIHGKVQGGSWDSYVGENLLQRIFGFEILMAPYAVAHLNLGMQLQKTGYHFEKEQRLGVYLTNTLEETAKRSEALFSDWISEEADAASEVKRQKAIMVVLGNPPYSGESQNKNVPWLNDLMRGRDSLSNRKCANYFACEGRPLGERNPKWLNDDYVKFMRFAHWRIEQTNHGVLAFITNNGYLQNQTFRGMREALMKDFDEIYILDLHGNSKKKELSPDGAKDENVFDIQQGVSICFMLRSESGGRAKDAKARVFRADLFGARESKFSWLDAHSFDDSGFKEVKPVSPQFLFDRQNQKLRSEYDEGMSLADVFPTNSVGIVSARDGLSIQLSPDQVWSNVRKFSSLSVSEARSQFSLGKDSRDWRVEWAQKDLKDSGLSKQKIVPILYRPFDRRYTYYTGVSRGFICMARSEVMENLVSGDNIAIIHPKYSKPSTRGFVTDCISGHKAYDAYDINYAFPLFIKDANSKLPNISKQAMDRCPVKDVESIFFYIYAVLNSTTYRSKYFDYLKNDFPKVQFTEDTSLFKRLSKLGKSLADLTLLRDDRLVGGPVSFSVKGSNRVERVRFDKKRKQVFINSSQYFDGIEENVWASNFGGYQVLEKWLKDRVGTVLSFADVTYYEKLVEALERSSKVVASIDFEIERAGGWPFAPEGAASYKKAA
jgi:hypothetical protein